MLAIEPHIQGLIFDCDGTLADTMPTHYRAWQETLSRFDAEFPELLFYDLAGVPSDKIVTILNEMFGYQLDPQAIADQKEARFLEILADVRPIEPVAALAWQYKGQLPMAVATGGIHKIVKPILQAIDMADLFDTIVTSEDIAHGKPAPDTFLESARRLNVPASRCQVFEDSNLGLEAADRAGMVATDVRPVYALQIQL